ncbi:MAG: hypothetical protein WC897_03970 [Candidatus Gracilibacteria bacterium]
MQKTLQNLGSASFVFLIIFGGLHISSSILIAEGTNNTIVSFLFNSLDLPFLLSALLYGISRISLNAEQVTGNAKTTLIICTALGVAIFCSALYLNFALPDAKLFG